jgi:hypothetical protein
MIGRGVYGFPEDFFSFFMYRILAKFNKKILTKLIEFAIEKENFPNFFVEK